MAVEPTAREIFDASARRYQEVAAKFLLLSK
jgi:hypothetical protein